MCKINKNMNSNTIEMSDYFREYLELKFTSLQGTVADIKDQQNNLELKINVLAHTINNLQLADAKHYSDCPNTDELRELKKNIEEFNGYKRLWKPLLIAAVVIVVITALGIIETVTKIQNNVNSIQKEQTVQKNNEIKSILK